MFVLPFKWLKCKKETKRKNASEVKKAEHHFLS